MNPSARAWLRRGGYALCALSALNIIVALFFLAFALVGPADRRTIAFTQMIINFGFAVANGILGIALLAGSRSR